jgi:hypothetical protein
MKCAISMVIGRKAKGVRPGFGFFEAILMVVLKNAGRIGRLPAPAEIAGV